MHSQNGKPDVLISAAIAARRARDRELENALQNPSMVELFKAILDHAFLLPLMELKLNQCTSFQGGANFSATKFGSTFLLQQRGTTALRKNLHLIRGHRNR